MYCVELQGSSKPLWKYIEYIALAYHFVREQVASHVVKIRKIDTKDNYKGDAFTKVLSGNKFNDFFYKQQYN